MILRTSPFALGLLAAALGVCGCGSIGSGTHRALTRAELIARADTICKGANTKRAAMPSINTRRDYAVILPRVATVYEAAIAELARLEPPLSIAADWKRILVDDRKLIGYLRTFGQHATSYDAKTTRAFVHTADGLRLSMATTAHGDGFADCAQFP
jgi:hypothetical protein